MAVAHPSPRNYFLILRIDPPRLNLDLEELERAFYKLSLEFHPDRNPNQTEANELTAFLNEAYRTLKDPWTRADYGAHLYKVSASKKVPTDLAEIYFELQDSNEHSEWKNFAGKLEELAENQNLRLKDLFQEFDRSDERQRKNIAEEMASLVHEHQYLESMRRDLETRMKVSHAV